MSRGLDARNANGAAPEPISPSIRALSGSYYAEANRGDSRLASWLWRLKSPHTRR